MLHLIIYKNNISNLLIIYTKSESKNNFKLILKIKTFK